MRASLLNRLSVLLLLHTFCVLHGHCKPAADTPTVNDPVEVAMSQLHVRENPNNWGPEISQYLATTGINFPAAWCAAFVNWCLNEADYGCAGSAWSPDWFRENVIYTRGDPDSQKPEPGDIFGIYFQSKKRVAHVGMIVAWPPGKYFVTIEGNTNMGGSRDGDGVYIRTRLKSNAYQVSRWKT